MISLADKLIACGASNRGPGSGNFISAADGTYLTYARYSAANSAGTVFAYSGTVGSTINYAFIMVADASGTVAWQRKISAASHVSDQGICFDSSGNIYVAVLHNATYATLTLLKYDSSGTLQWQRTLSQTSKYVTATGRCFDIDADDNIYIVAGGEYTPLSKGCIVKYSSSGTLQWQKSLVDASQHLKFNHCKVLPSGDVVVGGTHNLLSGVLVKYNNAGGRSAYVKYALDNTAYPYSICVDTSGNVYSCAYSAMSTSYTACAVTKFNSSLIKQWSQFINVPSVNLTYSGLASVCDSTNVMVSVHRDTTPYGEYVVALNQATGANAWIRKLTVYADATTTFIRSLLVSGEKTLVCGSGKVNGTTTNGFAGVLSTSDTLGSWGSEFTLTEPTELTNTVTGYSTATLTLTDATGDLLDAAGSLTDATATLTITLHSETA